MIRGRFFLLILTKDFGHDKIYRGDYMSIMTDRLERSSSGCFVRCVGVSDSYLQDIQELDRRFGGEGYLRLNKLDTPQSMDEVDRLRRESADFADSFEGARLLALYRESISTVNPSIETNLIISLLHWSRLMGSRTGGVLVCCGKIGYKEYLFCYLAYMKGWRVLMLMPEGEGKLSDVLTEKSELINLGMPYAVEIPPYVPPRPVPPPPPVRQPAPSAPYQQTYPRTQQRPQQPGNIRVAIPPRERRQGPRPNAPMRGDSENIKVKIPPRPRKSSTNVPRQTYSAGAQQFSSCQIPPARNQYTPRPQNSYAPAPQQYTTRRELTSEEIARLAESVVMITICDKFGDMVGTASGIAISRDGYILTNHHVISKGSYFLVRLENDRTAYPVQVVKYNNVHDMALLKINRSMKPLPLYRDRKNDLVRGQKVIAIGSPLGLFNTVSDGIISGFREIGVTDMIQFTAPISPGSSGGALLNTCGEIVGMCTGGAKDGQNINLAVSCRMIEPFIINFI